MSMRMFQKVRRAEESKMLEEKAHIYEKHGPEELEEFEENFQFTEGYKRSLYNEYVWHHRNGNRKMEKYMIENFMTVENF
jgi:hypothetical protein